MSQILYAALNTRLQHGGLSGFMDVMSCLSPFPLIYILFYFFLTWVVQAGFGEMSHVGLRRGNVAVETNNMWQRWTGTSQEDIIILSAYKKKIKKKKLDSYFWSALRIKVQKCFCWIRPLLILSISSNRWSIKHKKMLKGHMGIFTVRFSLKTMSNLCLSCSR